jgi:carbamoylphosphate synthase large subunit
VCQASRNIAANQKDSVWRNDISSILFRIVCKKANGITPYQKSFSKTRVLDHFKHTDQYLPRVLIPRAVSLEQRRQAAQAFIEDVSLPLVAKPDLGVVGIGVRRIDSREELNDIFGRFDMKIRDKDSLPIDPL